MDQIKQYLLTLVAAAIICALTTNLINKSTLPGSLVKLLSGIFLSICFLSPIVDLDLGSLDDYLEAFSYESDSAVLAGAEISDSSLRQSIKQQTETYILDKATAMNADLSVEVTLSDDELPVPVGVELTGSVSPYVKYRLSEVLTSDLGISKENQLWNQ